VIAEEGSSAAPTLSEEITMRLPRRFAALAGGAAVVAAAAFVVPSTATAAPAAAPAPAAAATKAHPLGTKPLSDTAKVFASSFDTDWNNFNVVSHAVFAVLGAKPKSSVGLLANGKVALTAFLPTDRAFQSLVYQKTGMFIENEQDVFKAVAGLGINTVEAVLLYHVVPGATIPASVAVKANGVRLKTAQGEKILVQVLGRKAKVIRLVDANRYNADPRVNKGQTDINVGNRQIAHGISQVLLPAGA
jgi:uncharacterized surface protein with fasciclin (FAS1) repeats